MVEAYEITGEWFGRLEELVEYIEENYEVGERNREYVEFYDEEKTYIAYLGGTERTIYIEKIVEA